MAKITKDNISDEQFIKVLWYFNTYHEILNKVSESQLEKLNFFQRKVLRKHINETNELHKQLDNL